MASPVRNWLILLPAAALVAALGYWNIDSDSPAKAAGSGSDSVTIDFYMTNSHTTQLNDEGLLHYEFTAERVDHVQETDISLMTAPDLHLHRGTEYPWHIRGVRGEAGPDGNEIQLFEQVRVERTDARGRPFILATEHLTYLPDTDHAFTGLPVQIDSAQGVTTASGMDAYLKQGTVHLRSTVRGRYENE
ncbi:LPS export ABC transporter periplasmic protein LptC [Thiopseudomonas denitrificans]|uniref:Lipopolysaccharide export system protein LptC n=1 Tax=Thiopseudomonas denitrificans TaxID=1501432 RepID=A0A4R6TVM3_9GAMM|nr:LPS export ABC transporter periplasmic protein LptC [Thiopseudomonas denitrificans]TDQ36293.1 lipopolysaccharide export system protein LptC [Thiopseudomonas denitrificans]